MPISTVWILKYVQQCYVKWFWTISSLGAPEISIYKVGFINKEFQKLTDININIPILSKTQIITMRVILVCLENADKIIHVLFNCICQYLG